MQCLSQWFSTGGGGGGAILPPQETVAIPGDICDWELGGRGALLASDLKN